MLIEYAMVDHGGLAVISLDGYMAVGLDTDALSEGDEVTVLLSDGEEIDGTFKSVVDSKGTVKLVSREAVQESQNIPGTAGQYLFWRHTFWRWNCCGMRSWQQWYSSDL